MKILPIGNLYIKTSNYIPKINKTNIFKRNDCFDTVSFSGGGIKTCRYDYESRSPKIYQEDHSSLGFHTKEILSEIDRRANNTIKLANSANLLAQKYKNKIIYAKRQQQATSKMKMYSNKTAGLDPSAVVAEKGAGKFLVTLSGDKEMIFAEVGKKNLIKRIDVVGWENVETDVVKKTTFLFGNDGKKLEHCITEIKLPYYKKQDMVFEDNKITTTRFGYLIPDEGIEDACVVFDQKGKIDEAKFATEVIKDGKSLQRIIQKKHTEQEGSSYVVSESIKDLNAKDNRNNTLCFDWISYN